VQRARTACQMMVSNPLRSTGFNNFREGPLGAARGRFHAFRPECGFHAGWLPLHTSRSSSAQCGGELSVIESEQLLRHLPKNFQFVPAGAGALILAKSVEKEPMGRHLGRHNRSCSTTLALPGNETRFLNTPSPKSASISPRVISEAASQRAFSGRPVFPIQRLKVRVSNILRTARLLRLVR
jgi:hypothetical protein